LPDIFAQAISALVLHGGPLRLVEVSSGGGGCGGGAAGPGRPLLVRKCWLQLTLYLVIVTNQSLTPVVESLVALKPVQLVYKSKI